MVEARAVAKIAVIGAGMMGSALCVPLADCGHDVRLVGTPLDDAIVQSLRMTRQHPRLGGLDLPAGVRVFDSSELARATEDADAFVLGVSSAGVGWAARVLAPSLAHHARPVLMLSKGLELGRDGLCVMTEVFKRAVAPADPACEPVAVCGPCIAGELGRRVPTLVVLTGRDRERAQTFADWLQTGYYWPRVQADVVGVQLCAALKNAYAMGVALGAGLHERTGGARASVAMHNYEAAVFAQAIVEMRALVAHLDGDVESVLGLAGSGDLSVTCNGGRTGRFGALLGRGRTAREARELMDGATLECLEVLSVLERFLAGPSAGSLARGDLPLLSHLIELGLHDAPLAMPFQEFFRA